MTNWFVNIGGKNIGPTTEEEIVSKIKAGQVNSSTMVWREGLTAWVPFSSSELAPLIEARPDSKAEGSDSRFPPLALVPPPVVLNTMGAAMPPMNDIPIVILLKDLSKASLTERLMLGCQTIALIFFLIASFKCLDSDMMLSRGFGIFLMGHTFMSARGVIATVSRLLGQKIEQQRAAEAQDKSAA